MVAGQGIVRNYGRYNNSPDTRYRTVGFSRLATTRSCLSSIQVNCGLITIETLTMTYDVHHLFSADYVVSPVVHFENRIVKGLLAGWQWSGKVYVRSGLLHRARWRGDIGPAEWCNSRVLTLRWWQCLQKWSREFRHHGLLECGRVCQHKRPQLQGIH